MTAPETVVTEKLSTPVTFSRARSPFGLGTTSGPAATSFTGTRPAADLRLVWANPGNGTGGVSEYRMQGYKVVKPTDVEVMDYGQYIPRDKDIGVYVDVDKKAERVEGSGGQVLMWCSGGHYRALLDEQARIGSWWGRKLKERTEDAGGTVEMEIAESTKLTKLEDL